MSLDPRPYPSRFDHCKCVFCDVDIQKNENIHWNRTTKGQTAHYECARKNQWSYASVPNKRSYTPKADRLPLPLPVMSNDTMPTNDVTRPNNDPLVNTIVEAIIPTLQERFNLSENIEKTIEDKVLQAIETLTNATRIEVYNRDTQETKDMGLQHRQFADVLTALQARDHKGHRLNLWITGAAGTGKTSACENAASALNMPFAFEGSIVDAMTQIFGWIRPHDGQLQRTPFREIWEHGGVFVFDDFDGSIPNEAMKLNTLLANGVCAFPDGMIKRHVDCVIILTANTFGQGATNDYVGRMKQDAAFLDRFSFIQWEIDEQLELATCPNETWCKRVQSVRAKVQRQGIKVLVTPRASYQGAALLATGMSQEKVEAMVLRKSMTSDQWKAVC